MRPTAVVFIVGLFAVMESASAQQKENATAPQKEFAGLNMGVGLSLTHDLGNNRRIKSATVVNGVVRVTEERDDVVRIMLESHFFFPQSGEFFLNPRVKGDQWGWGPFVAIQPGSDELIEAIGFGVMLGFKRKADKEETSSWNIGFGAVVDPSVQVLGDGVRANEPLPAGETEVRLKTKSQWGLLIITSFTF